MRTNTLKERLCKHCNKAFNFRACPTDVASGRGSYCSKACAHKGRVKLPQLFVCPHCKKEFANRYGKVSKYCSKDCSNKSKIGGVGWNRGQTTPEATRIKQSQSKKRLYASGWLPARAWKPGNHPWNKGVSAYRTLGQQIRGLKQMEDWRAIVFLIWENQCADCGATRWLQAHHIYEFHHIVAEEGITSLEKAENCTRLWDVTNGVVLCTPCHRKAHFDYKQVRIALKELTQEGYIEKRVEQVKGRPVTSYRAI